MSSILTNNGAMVALQTLKTINNDLGKTQSMISTGKEVSTAKDNASVWSISKTMESDVKGFKAITDSLSRGETTVGVARQASETITDLLTDMKGKIVAAQEGSDSERAKIQTDIQALTDQIGAVVGAAQFNGVNLIDGSSTEDYNVLSSLNRGADGIVQTSSIDVGRQNLSLTSSAAVADFATATPAAAGAATTALGSVGGADASAATGIDVANGGSNTIEINSVTEGSSFRLTLSDVELSAPDGSTSIGSREFTYIASSTDSVDSVRDNLLAQVNAYLGQETDAGTYTAAATANAGEFSLASAATGADPLNVRFEVGTGGTPDTTPSSGGLGQLASMDVSSDAGAQSALDSIDALIDQSINASAAFGSAQGRIETQGDFVSKLSDSLKSGIGSLVDADMEATSARLQALQVQQQLGVQSLSIANQAPQSILSLFR